MLNPNADPHQGILKGDNACLIHWAGLQLSHCQHFASSVKDGKVK